ncbi:MAG: hypothetical protein RLZZ546_1495 [Bacteroidota bacterium]|jgi:hypothetical protein
MEKLIKLIQEHKEAIDSNIEPNSERIKLINSTFSKVKEEALSLNKKENPEMCNYVDLEKIFTVCKKLSPTEGYWEHMIIKSLYFPNQMTITDVFDMGRFTERMFKYAGDNALHFWIILKYKQTLQSNFSKKN